ncbi:hypothetical protein Cgig2_021489 [Carnegiea gigantea]|uniref:Uncharacterized protein n=1 Tax=Carnegiea gigantea TaxID=171969 RepID=A0A9Q1KE31_9CARY|nr:hypothetical protein Cgig2_021489 [Carnegiea gigantea]
MRPKEAQGHQSIWTQCKVVTESNQERHHHCPSNQMVTLELNLLIMAISDLILSNLVPLFLMMVVSYLMLNHQNILLFNHDGGRSHVELSTKANPTSGGTLIKGCKPSLHSHAENQKRTLVGMNKQVKNTPIISSRMLQKAIAEHGTAIRHGKKFRAQVDILVDTVLRNHPKELHQYRSSEKKELIAMGICKRKAKPSMLDMVLCEKLDEITLVNLSLLSAVYNNVTTKGNVQREGTRNGGNVGP